MSLIDIFEPAPVPTSQARVVKRATARRKVLQRAAPGEGAGYAYNKAYREKHKRRIANRKRKWRKAHLAATRVYQREWRRKKFAGVVPKWKRGEKSPWAKLTEAQVRAMRERYAAGGISLAALSVDYGVVPSAAWKIVNRRAWAHVA